MSFFTPGRLSGSGFQSGFEPRHISGLLAWWSAQENVLNASSNPAADNNAVATWTDKVNGRTFTQSTSDNRPVYKTGIVNGYPIIRFDGTDDMLVGDAATRTFTQNKPSITALLVGSFRAFKAAATSTAVGVTGATGAARLTIAAGANSSGSTSRRTVGRSLDSDSFSELASSPNLYPTGFEILALQQDYTNKSGRMLRNGSIIFDYVQYPNMTAGNTSDTTSSAFTIGSTNGTGPSEYDAAELLFFDGLVSDQALRQLALYFGAIYGIIIS